MSYNLLKFLHVASVAVWIGGMVMLLLLNQIFQSAGDHTSVQALGKANGKLGPRLFLPAVLLTVITGIGAVQMGGLHFGSTWIMWGIVGVVVSLVVGGVLAGGAAHKLGQRIARGEVDAAGVAAAQRRILVFALLNVLLLLSVVWAMVFKPV